MLSTKQKNIIDIIQWVLIVLLLCLCVYTCNGNKKAKTTAESFTVDNTYVKIYESQTIEALKKENKALYDTIKNIPNVESAIQIKYKYKYLTDTVFVKEFAQTEDSVYHYDNNNDTVNITMDIKASELKWARSGFTINDRFMIVNREKDGSNFMTIDYSDFIEIETVDTWKRINKHKWYQKFSFSPQVGFGYGLINGKPDIYVGVGVGYKFGNY